MGGEATNQALRNTVELNAGRLVEIRIEAGFRTPEEVDATFAQIEEVVARLPQGLQFVTIVDWRKSSLMSPEAAAHTVERIMGLQHRSQRSAVVVSPEMASVVLQFGRVVRDTDNPARKMCLDAAEAITWLDELLSLEERARLRWFLERP
jgi:hypothetical protein